MLGMSPNTNFSKESHCEVEIDSLTPLMILQNRQLCGNVVRSHYYRACIDQQFNLAREVILEASVESMD